MNVQKTSPEKSQPTLCHSCQTFYGSPKQQGLCSSCFKKANVSKQQDTQTVQLQKDLVKMSIHDKVELIKTEQLQEDLQKDRKRCFNCQKKVGMLGTECKCKFVFCNSHRLPEAHNCSFDFKAAGHKQLQRTVIKVSNGKIAQI